MHKKHFEALARGIARFVHRYGLDEEGIVLLTKEIGAVCADFNPLFDYTRFFDAVCHEIMALKLGIKKEGG